MSATERSDLAAFTERRALCDHWRGEEANDAARAAEIAAQAKATCHGTDAELARLKLRYRGQRAIIEALTRYDPDVE